MRRKYVMATAKCSPLPVPGPARRAAGREGSADTDPGRRPRASPRRLRATADAVRRIRALPATDAVRCGIFLVWGRGGITQSRSPGRPARAGGRRWFGLPSPKLSARAPRLARA